MENIPNSSGTTQGRSGQDGQSSAATAEQSDRRTDGSTTPLVRTSRLPSPAQDYQPSSSLAARKYHIDASIVLIGIRGTGMSTLGVMASSALGFRLVDADHHFYQSTNLSRAAYKSAHGVAQYRKEELRLMRCMLDENRARTVIICGPGVVEETGQTWLTEYARSHAVIYVMRDVEGIEKHLRVWNADTISRLSRLSGPTHRNLSNFEFYNLSDPSPRELGHTLRSGRQSPRSLALKHLEVDFLHFVFAITQRSQPHVARNSLSYVPPESRYFTYALSLPIAIPAAVLSELGRQDIVADALELVVPFTEATKDGRVFEHSLANDISRQYYLARRNLALPTIIHVQTDGVNLRSPDNAGAEQAYFEVLYHGLRLAPEYTSVDLRCSVESIKNLIAMKGPTKVIGHFFAPSSASQGWDHPERKEWITRAQDLGCDMVRLCQEATSVDDNFLVQKFTQDVKKSGQSRIPLIAYNTGPLGKTSLFLNSVFSPVTHTLLRSDAPECPLSSLITIQEAQNALYSCFLLDPVYFGIFGSNVAQSLSPAMHNAAFRFYDMPHQYQIFQHQTLSEIQKLIDDPKFNGASITAPFKRDIIALLDDISPEARAIGAVNTLLPLQSANKDSLLIRNRAGRAVALYGENTDWIGIHVCIRRNLSPINAVRRRTSALILGAGGMARAAIYALIRLGVRTIFIQNRTVANAEELSKQFQHLTPSEPAKVSRVSDSESARSTAEPSDPVNLTIRVIPSKDDPWPADAAHPTIIVSCIPTRDIDGKCSVDTSIPSSWLSSSTGGVAVELSYTPLETPLIKQIYEKADDGWIAVDGLQVLPEQGIVQFELFTGRKPPLELMRRELLYAYHQRLEKSSANSP